MQGVPRSLFTLDLAAVRHNASRLLAVLGGAELWAVVKADGYGHGAVDVGRAALEAGASMLCVATVGEALDLRAALAGARILVMGPTDAEEVAVARNAASSSPSLGGPVPEGLPVHVKLDTGMGRWGLSELPAPTRDVVAVDEPLRERRLRPGVHRAPADAFPRRRLPATVASPGTSRTAPGRSAYPTMLASTRRGAGSRSTASRRSATIRPLTACGRH